MKSNLTESQHIRQMLKDMDDPRRVNPPDDDPDYSGHPHVTALLDPIREQQQLIAKLQKLSQKDPERALSILQDKGNPILAANPIDRINTADRNVDRSVEEKAEQIFDKYEDTVENLPEEPGELDEYLQTVAMALEELDDLIVDMEQEIGSAAAEWGDDDFDIPDEPEPPPYYDGGPY